MSDLISRQDTIDRINEYIEEYSEIDSDSNHSEKWCAMQEAKMTIENMPSAQPEKRTEKRTESHACDLISRQAAIDALHMHLMYRMGTDSNKKRLDEWINNLPPAQPDIIRCKDCKHWRQQTNYQGAPLSFGFCESDDMWRSLYGETYEVSHIDTDDDFYCGYAERRTDE